MGILKWAAKAAVVACAWTGAAHANPQMQWGETDFTFSTYELKLVDYTIVPDGKLYRWDFTIESDDPNATLTLWGPNQVYLGHMYKRTPDISPAWTFDGGVFVDYTFEEYFRGPGLVSYLVSAPAEWSDCDKPLPIGSVCGETYQVYGNGTFLLSSSPLPVTAHLTITAVPEPATWAMMIAGFGLAGAGLRRRRRLVGQG